MTFGRTTPGPFSSFGPGGGAAPDRRFDAPYADAVLDGFGGPAPAASDAGHADAHGTAGARAGAVSLGPALLRAPATPIGGRSTITATITNREGSEIAVDSLAVSNRAFTAELTGSNAIGAGESATIEITFAPTPPMLGAQHAMLTVALQNGSMLSAPISAQVETGSAAPSSSGPAPTADARGGRTSDPLAAAWPQGPREQCSPDNHGRIRVGDLRASRVHNPGSPGEFRDPVATTLYPGDRLELAIDLPGASAEAFGRVVDSAGLLAMRAVERRGDALVLVAEATRMGRTFTTLVVLDHGEEIARLPHGELAVIDALADDDPSANDSQRVKTTDIELAIEQIRVGMDSLFRAQKDGVAHAQLKLLQQPARPKTPWYAEVFALGAEAAISFVTAGVGSRLGRALAKWSMHGVRDLDLGKVPLFDWESAFGAGFKDSLKHVTRDHVLGSGGTDGMTVDEQWAIAMFCTAQISALEKVTLDLHGEFNNGAKAYKDLEAARPGLGLSAAEAHRHALVETREHLLEESEQSTVREWLKSLAVSTHGTLADQPSSSTISRGDAGARAATGGSDLGRPGRGQLVMTVHPGDPAAPPTPGSMGVAGVEGPAPTVLRGTVEELGLPLEVHLGTMVLRRNETGQVWVETRGTMAVLGGNLSRRDQEYLFAKGTGRARWENEAELQAGVDAGAEKLFAEVMAFPVRIR
jgi:hypothetical protein